MKNCQCKVYEMGLLLTDMDTKSFTIPYHMNIYSSLVCIADGPVGTMGKPTHLGWLI